MVMCTLNQVHCWEVGLKGSLRPGAFRLLLGGGPLGRRGVTTESSLPVCYPFSWSETGVIIQPVGTQPQVIMHTLTFKSGVLIGLCLLPGDYDKVCEAMSPIPDHVGDMSQWQGPLGRLSLSHLPIFLTFYFPLFILPDTNIPNKSFLITSFVWPSLYLCKLFSQRWKHTYKLLGVI